jgi:hypothetical protein
MAISQNKYIKITSDVDQFSLGERDFSGLVFTPIEMSKSISAKVKALSDTTYLYVVRYNSYTSIAKDFDEDSPILTFANKYFGYRAPDGQVADALTIAYWDKTHYESASNRSKILSDLIEGSATGENIDVSEGFRNFGSFTFIGDDGTVTDDKTIATYNSGLDHAYLFCPSVVFDSTAASSTYMSTLGTDASGTFVYFGADAYGCAFPMAILGSINFSGRDTTQCFMFKQLSGETPTIKNDEDYEAMKAINANFYGLAQTNGRSFAFLQRGFNSNGEDAGVYVNEMWLKSAIAADFLELCMNQNKIPANATGEAMIHAAIIGDVNMAIQNGTILAAKTLTTSDQAEITRFAGTSDAVSAVQTYGYYLTVKIEKDTDGEYKAYYYLVYGKGDGVRFCEGQHKLI